MSFLKQHPSVQSAILAFPPPAVRKYIFPQPVGPGQHRLAILREVSAVLMKSPLCCLVCTSSSKLGHGDLALAQSMNSPSPSGRSGQPRKNPLPISNNLRQGTPARATCPAPDGYLIRLNPPPSGFSASSSFFPNLTTFPFAFQPHSSISHHFHTGHDGVLRSPL